MSTSATPLYITVLPVLYNNTVEVSTGVDLPGLGNYEGVEYSFTVPTVGPAPDAINVSIAGSVEITACGFLCGNDSAWTVVLNSVNLTNLLGGNAATALWCYTAGTSSCQSETLTEVAFNLSLYSGQTLWLLVYDNHSEYETASINVNVYYEA